MREAVIVSTARTPIGRAYRGAFNATPSPTLTAHAIRAGEGDAFISAGVETVSRYGNGMADSGPTLRNTRNSWNACSATASAQLGPAGRDPAALLRPAADDVLRCWPVSRAVIPSR